MTVFKTFFLLALAGVMRTWTFGFQRPPPRYSQQYMPQTSFTCRNKIVGSYYADAETDCQLFHVCVSVAGSIQDYRFLCPNDTAFDQESQTCADWYDVDCEAATLYYASDNFDLYRIGSGLESLHYDNVRGEFEPQDHLQRSESNDPIRSSLNTYNSNSYKELDTTNKVSLHGNDFGQHNSRYLSRNQQQVSSDVDKKESIKQELVRKGSIRKTVRKPVDINFANTLVYNNKSTTKVLTMPQSRYNDKAFGQSFAYSTTVQPSLSQAALNTQKYNAVPFKSNPMTKYELMTSRSMTNLQESHSNYQTTTTKFNSHNNFNNINGFVTTAKPMNIISTHYPEPQNVPGQFTLAVSSTTKQPATDLLLNQSNNFYNNNINNNNHVHNSNITRINVTSYFLSTPGYDNYNNINNNNNNYYTQDNHQSKKADHNVNSYTTNTYAPTTYTPVTKKKANNNRHYYDKLSTLTTKSVQYIETNSTKMQKKSSYHKGHQNYEVTTKSYDFSRASVGFGFSPSSVNHLAENIQSTTPTARQAAAPTTYNPNTINSNIRASQVQQKSTNLQNQSIKLYSTTTKYHEEITARPEITKKNDYDYAYYDNAPLEYDNIELEHVSSNKESVKII